MEALIGFPFMYAVLNPATIALVNTLFRLANVIILLPFTGALEKLVIALIPEGEHEEDTDLLPMFELETRLLPYPALALEQVKRAVSDMASSTADSVKEAFAYFENPSEETLKRVNQLENLADRYESAIGAYLSELNQSDLDIKQHEEVFRYLHALNDIEQISDYAKHVTFVISDGHEKKAYSDEVSAELSVIRDAVEELTQKSMGLLTEEERSYNENILSLAVVIIGLCHQVETLQTQRVQNGECTVEQAANINELISDFGRITTQCSRAAIESSGINASEIRARSLELRKQDLTSLDLRNSRAASAVAEYRQKYRIG